MSQAAANTQPTCLGTQLEKQSFTPRPEGQPVVAEADGRQEGATENKALCVSSLLASPGQRRAVSKHTLRAALS